ncbi:uncharacterized protein PGTG_16394 [Puccinia graminis f. sp. tritici CRL 75-36-700-3]|uniref:Fumarylacetoacetase-like C-terminal domain-containing protein n=1 Tax=Puccinia graminis f. sp. tritici (strain CRL 75-36-700-3 / race SCCL) TaxID=418459 RepID=E3L3S8_PUCGT|nr:uncharacterized protein PGTG_16394 [Puccinia graminis f. sp. tritici CRL 75-36-700-3]EFP91203.2 hypothetical protein PGTG_16394 [Puccinia graminis f. sp. tritici CRL 75-36-700-3]
MASIAANFVGQGKKIIGIGRNYLDHVQELKNQVPSKPFFFLKPTTSYITRGQKIEIPSGINCHHEVELGVIIGTKCRSVTAQKAMSHVAGYTIAIDLTARNLQEDIKRKQLPWSSVKGFDTFCPVGKFIEAQHIVDPHQLSIWLKLNGQLKQHSSTQNMIHKIPELIAYCSGIMTLEEGDLLLTGTPAGVSSVSPGDEIEIGLEQASKPTDPSMSILDQLKFSAIQRPDGLTYDHLKV